MTHFFPEPADSSERALLDRVARWNGARDLAELTPELLVELTEREGSDFATAPLHQRIVASEQHGPFLRALHEPAVASGESPVVAIVPGAFYRENPRTGADGEMQRGPGSPLAAPLVLPPYPRTIHVVGFPLLAHLRNGLVRRCHARLTQFGPNDGSLVLSDVIRWPGQLCPVWGADHYLEPREDVRPLLAALLGEFLA